MTKEEQRVALKLELFEARAKQKYKFQIRHKEDVLGWQILTVIVFFLTFFQVNLLEKSWVTIGKVVYVPRRYDPKQRKVYRYGDLPFEDYCALSHELEHIKQYAKFGVVVFLLIYIFPFFPIGLAYGRYWLERQAYLAGILAAKSIEYEAWARQHYLETPTPPLEKAIQACSTSPWYLWPWPFQASVRRWFEAALLREEERYRNVLQSVQVD
jgi:hypothetical protein